MNLGTLGLGIRPRLLFLLPSLLPVGLLPSVTSYGASVENLYVPQAEIPTPGPNLKHTANFGDLRHNVLDLLSSSKKRVWLLTDYLTDGDIVSALFLAKYRKVDVKVFLGQNRLNSYMSRLNYLKAQNVPVFERPEHGFIAPTILLIDQRLFTINRDLNVLAQGGQAQMTQASPTDVATFVAWFKEVIEHPIAVEAKPLPAVGKAGGGGKGVSRPAREWQSSPAVSSYQGESDGSYNYDRSGLSRRAPEGISTKLPRVPRYQKPAQPEEAPVPAGPVPAAAGVEVQEPADTGKSDLFAPGPQSPIEINNLSQPRPDEVQEKVLISPPSEER